MIRVESISITEFRGIRSLSLELGGKNFAICGPNGTGKSGIVDALEFALTGTISRLSGEGRGEVSVKQHGPHVDKRNDPAKARVRVEVSVPGLNRRCSIERSVSAPATPIITPSDPAILKVLGRVLAHPEIVLSRRQLIRYVLAPPGKRADEVQALLHLDQIEQVRTGLQKIANTCEKQAALLKTAAKEATDNLVKALGISECTKDKVIAATNEQRAVLGLAALPDLTKDVSLKDGMAAPAPVQPQRIPKVQAQSEIAAAREALSAITVRCSSTDFANLLSELTALSSTAALADALKRESFYTHGTELIGENACPFCDNEWEPELLREKIRVKLEHLRETGEKRRAAQAKLAPLMSEIRKGRTAIDNLSRYASLGSPPASLSTAQRFSTALAKHLDTLTAFVPVSDTLTALHSIAIVPTEISDFISEFEAIVAALPEPTKQDAAREWLSAAQVRLEVWQDARRKLETALTRETVTRQVSNIYASTSDTVLGSIYARVQKDFAELYGSMNRGDEDNFTARLVPSMGKLGFDVDFYGRGYFPPGAYHSEGHQDGMGLCLYLSLMGHLFGAGFSFAILDDVLMSVDAGHRREVCALLKQRFPTTQFILTTHDPIWLRHMKTEGLIQSSASVLFRSWHVDQGPMEWHERNVWSEIDERLDRNDVREASALLRYYLEYITSELCHKLRVPVEFRGDAQFQLGDLLPPLLGRVKDLLAKGREAAISWGEADVAAQIEARASKFAALVAQTNVEQWQVNSAVHFNSWINLLKPDFAPVVLAFRALLESLFCSRCQEYVRVMPERGRRETLRCECAETDINLVKK